jgi:hypothetical protein
MNSKDYRNIREAYLDVYNDDLREEQEFKSWVTELLDEGYDLSDYTWDEMYDIYNKESYDLYDIILSHLIDEGYADTEQTAEAIMVNMSEEWKEIIVVEDIESRREMIRQKSTQQRISSAEAQKRKKFKEQDRESLKREIIRDLIRRQQSSTN